MQTIIIHTQDLSLAQKISNSLDGVLNKKKNHYRVSTHNSINLTQLRDLKKIDINLVSPKFNYSNVKLLVSDMDSTLITIETIDEIARLRGKSNEVTSITEDAMQGRLDFEESFKKRVSILKGTNISTFKTVYDSHLTLSQGAHEMIDFFKSINVKSAVVSGGLNYFAERLHKELKIDTFRANNVEIINQGLSGKVLGNVIDAKEKAHYINELCSLYQIETDQVIAIGDGANDIEMMKVSGMSVAYKGKPLLQKNCDVVLNYSGLDAVIDFFDN